MTHVIASDYKFFCKKLEDAYNALNKELKKEIEFQNFHIENNFIRIDKNSIDLSIENLKNVLKKINQLKTYNPHAIR